MADDGHRWNVSPRLLRLAESTLEAAKTQEAAHPSTVIPLKQKWTGWSSSVWAAPES